MTQELRKKVGSKDIISPRKRATVHMDLLLAMYPGTKKANIHEWLRHRGMYVSRTSDVMIYIQDGPHSPGYDKKKYKKTTTVGDRNMYEDVTVSDIDL